MKTHPTLSNHSNHFLGGLARTAWQDHVENQHFVEDYGYPSLSITHQRLVYPYYPITTTSHLIALLKLLAVTPKTSGCYVKETAL